MADAVDLKSITERCAGSSPAHCTMEFTDKEFSLLLNALCTHRCTQYLSCEDYEATIALQDRLSSYRKAQSLNDERYANLRNTELEHAKALKK